MECPISQSAWMSSVSSLHHARMRIKTFIPKGNFAHTNHTRKTQTSIYIVARSKCHLVKIKSLVHITPPTIFFQQCHVYALYRAIRYNIQLVYFNSQVESLAPKYLQKYKWRRLAITICIWGELEWEGLERGRASEGQGGRGGVLGSDGECWNRGGRSLRFLLPYPSPRLI